MQAIRSSDPHREKSWSVPILEEKPGFLKKIHSSLEILFTFLFFSIWKWNSKFLWKISPNLSLEVYTVKEVRKWVCYTFAWRGKLFTSGPCIRRSTTKSPSGRWKGVINRLWIWIQVDLAPWTWVSFWTFLRFFFPSLPNVDNIPEFLKKAWYEHRATH